jgi:tetratricopeptide (TPR) repeat protein
MGKKRRPQRSARSEPTERRPPAAGSQVPPAEPRAAATQDPSPPAADLSWSWALGIFGLAFAVRVAVAVQLGRTVLYRFPQLDSLEFLEWAGRIAHGRFGWPDAPTHGPGYPYFLGLLLAVFDGSLAAVRIVQAALGALACVLTALLAARLFADRRAGVVAGALLALYGPLVFVETALLAEGLFVLLLVAALWLLTRPIERPRVAVVAAGGAGLLLGLAAVVRATALPLIPLLVLAVAMERWRVGRVARAAAVAAGALLVVLPVLVQVRQVAGGWLPIQGFGGLNLYMGNRAGAPGVPAARLGGEWDRLSNEPARLGITGLAAQERHFTRKAWAEARERPLAVLGGLARKAVWLVQDEEIRESHSFYFFRRHSGVLAGLPGFALLFPLGAVGLALLASRRRLPGVLAVYSLAMAASCVAIVVSSRYRLPLVPVLAAAAGGAAVFALDAIRSGRWRSLAPYAMLAAVALLATQLRDHEPSRNGAEEWALTALSLEARDELDRAGAAVDAALAEDPRSALAWAVAGRLAERRGDLAGAQEAFATSARINPGFHRARLNLGTMLRRRGDLEGAERELREALAIVPGDQAARRQLAEVLMARGELSEARRVFEQIVERDGDDAAAYLALARIAGAERRPKEGLELASRAAHLDPRSGEAWMLYAMLALDAGDAGTAGDALGRAGALLGDEAPPVELGQAILDRLRGRPREAEERLRRLLRREPGYEPAAQQLLAIAADRGAQELAEAQAFLRQLRG